MGKVGDSVDFIGIECRVEIRGEKCWRG